MLQILACMARWGGVEYFPSANWEIYVYLLLSCKHVCFGHYQQWINGWFSFVTLLFISFTSRRVWTRPQHWEVSVCGTAQWLDSCWHCCIESLVSFQLINVSSIFEVIFLHYFRGKAKAKVKARKLGVKQKRRRRRRRMGWKSRIGPKITQSYSLWMCLLDVVVCPLIWQFYILHRTMKEFPLEVKDGSCIGCTAIFI